MGYHSLYMSQPLKLADDLLIEARLSGEIAKRTTAAQIEFWAALGRALEPHLKGDRVQALLKAGKTRALSECLRVVDAPEGRARVAAFLEQQPFPHYEAAPGRKGLWVRTDKAGKRMTGRFVGRQFQRAD